jgi:hypothetical protein
MAAAFVTLSLHMTRHLPRALPWHFQKLRVDERHELESLGTFPAGLVV